MRNTPLLLFVVGSTVGCALAGDGATAPLKAGVDARVELMSVIFRLAGNPEYNQPNSKSPYADAVETQFGPYREHPVVKLARKLRAEHGVSYDAVMSMAMHIEDTIGFKERVPFDQKPPRLDSRWKVDDAREFLRLARDFVEQTEFNMFFRKHRRLFDQAAARMEQTLSGRGYVAWFDAFFGARPQAKFRVYIGLLNGGACYGSGIVYPDGREEICPVIGAWEFDDEGIPVFDAGIAGTVVHELCHSYTNALVDKHAEALRAPGQKIFAQCADVMRRQAYGTWKTLMYESLVRATVVRHFHATDGPAAARQEIQRQQGKGFEWIGELSELMAEYEADRTRYRNFDAFMPRVVAFFNQYAETYAEKKAAAAARAPKVVSMTPANGATDVDPGLAEIVITFDRPMMDQMWSVVGGGPHFPEITGQVHYDAARRVFTMPVRLKPDWSYEFWLNRGRFNTFRSADGVPLEPVHVTFETRPE